MLAALLLPVWGIVDAATRPEQAWTAIRQSRWTWILLQGVLIVVPAWA